MCGIGGILRVWPTEQRELALRTPHDQSIPEHWLNVIDDAIKHRGPDGHGRFRDRTIRADGCVVDVALVHRRLSIIDHAGGHQPMVLRIPRTHRGPSASSGLSTSSSPEAKNTPGRLLTPEDLTAHNRRILAEGHEALSTEEHNHIAVVFNGCIYNHRELRAELQRAGHVFHTDHSDTEVLVHGWREWGTSLVDHLDGMFAFTIWDSLRAELSLARDRAGEKPLYFWQHVSREPGRVLAFASSAAPLRPIQQQVDGSGGGDIAADTLWSWIAFGAASGSPMWNVEPVWPGSVFGQARWRDHSYGSIHSRTLPERQVDKPLSDHQLDKLLGESVAKRLEADVPVGCFLSGGVDSSLVSVLAMRARPDLRTFCVQMPDERFDESTFAQSVATRIGSDHKTLPCSARPAEDLQALVQQIGLPFGDSSVLPSLWVSRAAKEHVGVALTGDGGDELFGGYDRYRAATWIRRYRSILAEVPIDLFSSANPKSRRARLRRLTLATRNGGYPSLLRIFDDEDLRLLGGDPALVSWTPNVVGASSSAAEVDPLRWDFSHYLPDDLMLKVDAASMHVSLETRAPLLSSEIVDAAMSATLSILMPRNQRKGLLRQVARKYLPAEIVDRPKMGFAIPIGEWFRTDYGGLRTMLLDHLNSSEPFGPPSLGIDLNRKYIQQMLDEHLGTGMSGRVTRDHSQRLYMLLVLSIWAKWYASLSK